VSGAGAARSTPAPVAERGPQPLAPSQQITDRVEHGQQILVDARQRSPLPADEAGERAPDVLPDLVDGCCAARHSREGNPARLVIGGRPPALDG